MTSKRQTTDVKLSEKEDKYVAVAISPKGRHAVDVALSSKEDQVIDFAFR